jgi:hypothetical protein
MTEAQVRENAAGAQIAPAQPAPEGLKEPVLTVTRGGKPVLYIEMKDGKAYRFTTEEPTMFTSYGAGVGMPVESLEQLYGQGEVVTVEGVPAVKFDVAPTLRFVLDKSVKAKKWADLVKENPPVKRIQVSEDWS